MKCFVIMPYATEFDDVHMAIERAVHSVRDPRGVECLRLDDDQRGGRIIGRLEHELRHCDMCVADLSGGRCNVMWEVGYAMALAKPIIVVSHGAVELHFDLHDVQHLRYDRAQLRKTLTEPLARAVEHTARFLVQGESTRAPAAVETTDPLRVELRELKSMVAGLVEHIVPRPAMSPPAGSTPRTSSPPRLAHRLLDERLVAGSWHNAETGTWIHARIIHDELFAPYCFGGNEGLTGIYHSARELGEYLHMRYEWIGSPIRGFALLRPESADRLVGAWWYDGEVDGLGDVGTGFPAVALPPIESGAQSQLTRVPGVRIPDWALKAHQLAETLGPRLALARLHSSRG